jgi:O-antigen ligase
MVALPLQLAIAMWRRSRANLTRLAIFGGGCFLLYSRTAIVVVVISVVAILVFGQRPRALITRFAPMAAGALMVFGLSYVIPRLPPLPPLPALPTFHLFNVPAASADVATGASTDQTLNRVQQLTPTTLSDRYAIWRDALSIFRRSPIIGVGYHDYFLYSRVIQIKNSTGPDPPGLFSSRIKQAHNDYLSWLSEAGVIGLALYLAFWAILFAGGVRMWRSEAENRMWHSATVGFLLGLAVVSLFGEVLIPRTPAWIAPTVVWWVLIAILLTDLNRRHQWLQPRPR